MTVLALPVLGRLEAEMVARVSVSKSGGRDLWSAPMTSDPEDAVEATWQLLGEVLDPELPISLPELGLIYGVEMVDGVARIRLTYTATGCPCMEFIREDITDRLESESWIGAVEILEVWDPPWTSDKITPEGRTKLRALGVSS